MKWVNRYRWGQWLVIIVVALLPNSLLADDSDSELWVSMFSSVWKSSDSKTKLMLYGEIRENDDMGSRLGAFGGPIVRHKVNDNVSAGAGIKFIDLENANGSNKHFRRYEMEITPSGRVNLFGRTYSVGLRNRVELILGSNDSERIRYRHRVMVSSKVASSRYIDAVYASQEYIYVSEGIDSTINQTRFIPVGVKLRVADDYKLNLFYMVNHKFSDPDQYNHVLGLGVYF